MTSEPSQIPRIEKTVVAGQEVPSADQGKTIEAKPRRRGHSAARLCCYAIVGFIAGVAGSAFFRGETAPSLLERVAGVWVARVPTKDEVPISDEEYQAALHDLERRTPATYEFTHDRLVIRNCDEKGEYRIRPHPAFLDVFIISRGGVDHEIACFQNGDELAVLWVTGWEYDVHGDSPKMRGDVSFFRRVSAAEKSWPKP